MSPPDLPKEAVEALADQFEFRAAIAAEVGIESRHGSAAEFCTGEHTAWTEAASDLRAAAHAIRKQRDEELRERAEKALEKVERLEMHMDHGLLPLPDGRFVRFHDIWLALDSIFEEDDDE